MRPTRPLRAGPATPYACTTLADCGHLDLHRRDRLCVGFTLGADVLTWSQIGSTPHGKPEETVSDGLVTRATSYAKDEAPRTPRPFMRAQGPGRGSPAEPVTVHAWSPPPRRTGSENPRRRRQTRDRSCVTPYQRSWGRRRARTGQTATMYACTTRPADQRIRPARPGMRAQLVDLVRTARATACPANRRGSRMQPWPLKGNCARGVGSSRGHVRRLHD